MNKRSARFQKRRGILLRVVGVLFLSLAIGAGVSLFRAKTYQPALDGDVSAVSVVDGMICCAVSRNQDSMLLRMDTDGTVRNYCRTDADQVFEALTGNGENIYAVMAANHGGKTTWKLVSLSLENVSMQPQTLVDLTSLPEVSGAEINWQSMILTDDGLHLAGTDAHGNGYGLTWCPDQNTYQLDKVLEGENILFLGQITENQFLYVTRDRQVNLYETGTIYRDLLQGIAETPLQVTACMDRGFLSDSITGNLYEIRGDGTVRLFRKGTDRIGTSGYTYSQYVAYTVYANDAGVLKAAGVCNSDKGAQMAGEDWTICAVTSTSHRLLLFWQHCWPIALAAFLMLSLMGLCLGRILHSPRLATRLTLCELAAALLLLGAMTVIQYRTYQDTLFVEARQKLQLLGGGLAANLETGTSLSGGEETDAVRQMQSQVSAVLSGEGKEYTLRVLWQTPDGPAIGYDDTIPAGYLVEDVETHNYLLAVEDVMEAGGTESRVVRGEMSTDYLYLQTFRQGNRTGCVTASQSEEVLLNGQARFFQRMLPILAACPLLFLALLWITRRLLSPLNTIQEALETFYTCGVGNQMELSGMPRTELYEVGRVFNQLSIETKTQLNALHSINDAYVRLIPNQMLRILGKTDVSSLKEGETVTLEAALLVVVPCAPDPGPCQSADLVNQAGDTIGACGGVVVDHDEGLRSLTAMFSAPDQAMKCARLCADGRQPVMVAVLEERVTFGLFGGKHLLVPLMISPSMARRLALLALLRRFGAKVVRSSRDAQGLRLLGWDQGTAFCEEITWRSPDWQAAWRDAESLWIQALEQYRKHAFAPAMRKFAEILRILPEDEAARWYLFRCGVLRDSAGEDPDTDLLYDWGGRT